MTFNFTPTIRYLRFELQNGTIIMFCWSIAYNDDEYCFSFFNINIEKTLVFLIRGKVQWRFFLRKFKLKGILILDKRKQIIDSLIFRFGNKLYYRHDVDLDEH